MKSRVWVKQDCMIIWTPVDILKLCNLNHSFQITNKINKAPNNKILNRILSKTFNIAPLFSSNNNNIFPKSSKDIRPSMPSILPDQQLRASHQVGTHIMITKTHNLFQYHLLQHQFPLLPQLCHHQVSLLPDRLCLQIPYHNCTLELQFHRIHTPMFHLFHLV